MLDSNHSYYQAFPSGFSFGCFRISKSASSSLLDYQPWHLSAKPKPFSFFADQSLPLVSIFRNPIERFYSGLFEFLSRVSPSDSHSRLSGGAVIVHDFQFSYFKSFSTVTSCQKLAQIVLDYIDSCGIPDAHLRPQIDFCRVPSLFTQPDIYLFDMSRLHEAFSVWNSIFNITGNPLPISNASSHKANLVPKFSQFNLYSLFFKRFIYSTTKIALPGLTTKNSSPFRATMSQILADYSLNKSFLLSSTNPIYSRIKSLYKEDFDLFDAITISSSPITSLY